MPSDGVDIEGKLAYLTQFQFQAGVTLQRSRYDEPYQWDDDAPAEKKMFRTPILTGISPLPIRR